MVATRTWRELARFEDAALARAVATTLAAMEYDVRLSGQRTDQRDVPAPLAIEVTVNDWDDLADVLEEIVNEQVEFDRLLAERTDGRMHGRLVIALTLTGAVDILVLLGLLEM